MTLAERLVTALASKDAPALPFFDADDIAVPSAPLVPAAVLIAITDRAEPGVILTQRTETLRAHAGQVAFPGGRIDPTDAGPVAAALREAEEEVAMPTAAVRTVGIATRYRTGTGFQITPVVGVIPPDLPLRPHEAEVASVFEVPLAFLLDPANHREVQADWQGRVRHFHEILWQDRRIWGATAAIILNLSRRLAWT